MVEKEEKYKIISTILPKQMDIIEIFDYKVIESRKEIIYPNIERYKVLFTNSKREILFSFVEKNIRNELLDSFRVMISKDEYSGFEFETYLKTIGIKAPEEKMRLINYEGDFKERLKKFCEFVKVIFEKHLQKVISGEEWINVSFDWGSYK